MTAYFVSKSTANGYAVGLDTNNGTSKATPFLTVGKALSVWLDGDTITINDGNYIPTDGGFGSFFDLHRSATVNSETYRGAVLVGLAGQARVANFGMSAGKTSIVNNVVFDGSALTAANANAIDTGGGTSTWKFNGCQFIGPTNATTSGCAKCNSTTGYYGFFGCKVSGGANTYGIWTSGPFIAGGNLEVDDLEVDLQSLTAAIGGPVLAQATAAGANARIHNVWGSCTANGSSGIAGIVSYDISNLVISGPCGPGGTVGPGDKELVVNGTSTNGVAGIKVKATRGFTLSNTTVDGCYVTNLTPTGYGILVGSDSSEGVGSDGMIVDSDVINCNVRGNPSSNIMHGIITGWQTGGTHMNNRIHGFYLSSLFKESIGRPGRSKRNKCFDGYPGTSAHLYSKGCSVGSIFVRNEVHLTSSYMNRAFQSGWNNTSTHVDTGSFFMANNIYCDSNVTQMTLIGGAGDATVTPTFLWNNYIIPSVSGNPWQVGQTPTNYATLAAWTAAVEPTAHTDVPTKQHPSFFRDTYAPQVRDFLLGTPMMAAYAQGMSI